MKKKFIVTEEQLKNYVERKKNEKIFAGILEEMKKNSKYLKENISLNNANQSIIDKFLNEKKITPDVKKLLKEFSIVDDDMQIL